MCSFACGDPRAVPSAAAPPDLQAEVEGPEGAGSGGGSSSSSGAQNGGSSRGGKAAALPTPAEQQEELAAQALALARRGGEAVLAAMARQAGPTLQQRLPKLWEQAAAPLAAMQAQGAAADPQAAVNALHVLAVLAPAVHADLAGQLEQLLPLVVLCLQQPNAAVKLAAARCVAALAQAHTVVLMPPVLRLLAPLLTGGYMHGATIADPGSAGCIRIAPAPAAPFAGCPLPRSQPTQLPRSLPPGPSAAGAADDARLGALLALHLSACALGLALVPYSLLVVVPLMGRMSDAHPLARSLAARTFAAVVAIMPLAQARGGDACLRVSCLAGLVGKVARQCLPGQPGSGAHPDLPAGALGCAQLPQGGGEPAGLDEAQRALLAREGRFLQQLLDNSALDDYSLPIKCVLPTCWP